MKTLESTMLQVLAYGKLTPGWNTPESLPPTPNTVKLACEFLRTIPEGFPLPGTMLHDNGDLGFYWFANQRCYIDMEIDAANDLFDLFTVKRETKDEPRAEYYRDRLTMEHFTVPFFIEHFTSIRDEYETRTANGPLGGTDTAHECPECKRDDALRV
jgi:hypothetical protein